MIGDIDDDGGDELYRESTDPVLDSLSNSYSDDNRILNR